MQLPLDNETPCKALVRLYPDDQGEEGLLLVAKASFELGRTATLAGEQMPIHLADCYRGGDARSSLLHASDLHPPKLAVDVLLEAEAVAPHARPASAVDVRVGVGPARCSLRVHGPRFWEKGAPGAAQPFIKAPLIYDLADGGGESIDNPSGIGWLRDCGAPAPRLEWLAAEESTPAGLGPIARHWRARAVFAGTYDSVWRRERAPLPPADFDQRFWQLAPTAMQVEQPLEGRAIALVGFHPREVISAKVPSLEIWAELTERGGGTPRLISMALDTLWICTLQRKLVLTFRALASLARGPEAMAGLRLRARQL